jgi:hypothetical protein
MESLFTVFLLFIAVLTALLTYLVIPYVPVMALTMASAVALVVFIWWHWTQFSVEYRLSTWQEVLRNYASYVLLLLAILVSYGFYVFVWVSNGGNVEAAFTKLQTNISNGLSRGVSSATRSLSSLTSEPRTNLRLE